jgi:cephalosporin hydroxylase
MALDRMFKVSTPEGERELDAYTEEGFAALAELFTRSGWQNKVSYELTWLGIPIIQLPEDILMMQELLWKVRPDVVVESGIAHGGALVLYASLLELLGRGKVVGVDIEIRKYNRLAMESHPMSDRITLIEDSSTSPEAVVAVKSEIRPGDKVLVALDSRHDYEHVREELDLYAPLVSPGSYLVVFDGVMPTVADAPNGDRSWDRDNPTEAIRDFLASNEEFEIDPLYNRLAGVTYCPGGFLRRRPKGEGEGDRDGRA